MEKLLLFTSYYWLPIDDSDCFVFPIVSQVNAFSLLQCNHALYKDDM